MKCIKSAPRDFVLPEICFGKMQIGQNKLSVHHLCKAKVAKTSRDLRCRFGVFIPSNVGRPAGRLAVASVVCNFRARLLNRATRCGCVIHWEIRGVNKSTFSYLQEKAEDGVTLLSVQNFRRVGARCSWTSTHRPNDKSRQAPTNSPLWCKCVSQANKMINVA